MDRRRAQSNVNSALAKAGIAIFMFGLTFYVAVLYIG